MSIEYQLIDLGRPRTTEEIALVNACFDSWCEVFGQDLESRGAHLNQDEFYRARILAVVSTDQKIIGFHLYSIFDLRERPSTQHGYFRAFPDSIKKDLQDKGTKSVLAMEYLTVLPEYRSQEFSGLRAAEIIIRLGLKVLETMQIDAALGVARLDRKVNALGDNIGFENLGSIEKYNNKCSLMSFDRHRQQLIANPFVQRFIDDLWQQRQQTNNSKIKAA